MRRQLTSKISILAASALTLGTCLPAGIAFADPDPETPPAPPSVGNQSGAGSTALTMVWENANAEYGGTEDPNNPPAITDPTDPNYDPDAPGVNLAFTAPTAINFVAKANGTLQGPSNGAAKIMNLSNYGVRVSSLDIDAASNDWHIVADATQSNAANAVSGLIGPENDQLAWASYLSKTDVATPYRWNMTATDGQDEGTDELPMNVSGNVANLAIDLSTAQTFATIHWYLKAGSADGPVAITSNAASVENGSFVIGTTDTATENEPLFAGNTAYVVTDPDDNYEVASVTVNGNALVADNGVYSFTVPSGTVNVAVTFQGVAATISKNNPSNGTFVVGTTSDASSDGTFRYGDTAYVVPSPAEGYEVESVTANGNTLIADNGTYHFTVGASNNVAVAFVAVPALPANQAAVASTSLSDLSAIGDYLRSGNADASYVSAAEALVGATMNVTLKTGTMTVRLADVSTTRGLTFEAVDILTTGIMNPSDTEHPDYGTNEGGWAASALRTSMNDAAGTIFTTYFEGTALNAAVHEVSNTSYDYNGGNGGTVSSSDKYWVPSMNNVFGTDWKTGVTAGEVFSDGSGDAQFDYYAGLDPAVDSNNWQGDTRLRKKNSSGISVGWKLRSACPSTDLSFMGVAGYGASGDYAANNEQGVAPCFCL